MLTDRLKKLLSLLFSLALLALTLWQRQNIYDWWRLRNYEPSAAIAVIAQNDTMTSLGTKLFYVHYPELKEKSSFGGLCPVHEETIVLGCYISHHKIYLLQVTDERLNGVHEVTAAHEMLHAAYDRLGGKEKETLNAQLQAFVATITDERLLETIDSYRKADPSIVPNELHSILGTEVRNLTPALEKHYSQYFSNRLKVVEYAEKYEEAFTNIKNKIDGYDARLETLKAQIDANEIRLKQMGDEINADQARLDAMLQSGDTGGYNAAVPDFNRKVRNYNNFLDETRRLISEYNEIVKERNALAAEQRALLDAIDSTID